VITSDTTAPPISPRLPDPLGMMPPVGKASRRDSRNAGNEIFGSAAEPTTRESLANRSDQDFGFAVRFCFLIGIGDLFASAVGYAP
jgi:hypothetical protein